MRLEESSFINRLKLLIVNKFEIHIFTSFSWVIDGFISLDKDHRISITDKNFDFIVELKSWCA